MCEGGTCLFFLPLRGGRGEVYKDVADTRNTSQDDHDLRGHN